MLGTLILLAGIAMVLVDPLGTGDERQRHSSTRPMNLEGRITFVREFVSGSRRYGPVDVVSMTVDGRSSRVLARGFLKGLSVAEDGSAFIVAGLPRGESRPGLYEARRAGDAFRLTVRERAGERFDIPSWSPDRRYIAVVSTRTTGRRTSDALVRIDRRTGRRTVLARSTDDASNFVPTWAPDGKQIAFTRGTRERQSVFVVNTGGGTLRRVTPVSKRFDFAVTPAYSPDGRTIAFVGTRKRDGRPNLFTIGSDGGRLRQLTDLRRGFLSYPSFSPDGTTLVYFRKTSNVLGNAGVRRSGSEIAAIDVKSGRTRTLRTFRNAATSYFNWR